MLPLSEAFQQLPECVTKFHTRWVYSSVIRVGLLLNCSLNRYYTLC